VWTRLGAFRPRETELTRGDSGGHYMKTCSVSEYRLSSVAFRRNASFLYFRVPCSLLPEIPYLLPRIRFRAPSPRRQDGTPGRASLAESRGYFSGGFSVAVSMALRRASSLSAGVRGFFGGAAPVMAMAFPKDDIPHVA
jgi:hypothetical protein